MIMDIMDILSSIKDFLYHIAPSLVGVITGGVIFQKYYASRANEAAFIDYLFKEFDHFRADSLEYWNLECTETKDQARARILEQKIKGTIRSLITDLMYYSARYHRKFSVTSLMVEVNHAATGGQFEVAKRPADGSRYAMVINSTNKLKSALIRRKL
jgi:hypothetical protein